MISEQGRAMALRAALSRRRGELQIFRSSAGLTKFAGVVSRELREWQRREYTAPALARLSERTELAEPLRRKLHDLALLLADYNQWLADRQLQDTDSLLEAATSALSRAENAAPGEPLAEKLWMDGFAEMTPREISLLAAVSRRCGEVTLAFCTDPAASAAAARLSIWSGVERTRRDCWTKLGEIPGARLTEEILQAAQGRFAANPTLRHLERHWPAPAEFNADPRPALRAAVCPTPAVEAAFAAREILRFVRDRGGRYREAAVLVRRMEGYGEILRRVFTRYEIPFFLDRREPAASHPLAELTRNAIRTVAFDWRRERLVRLALKTGWVAQHDGDVDWRENAALERGWTGDAWLPPVRGKRRRSRRASP